MDPDGSRHLGDPAHRLLHVARRHHHEVVELVYDDKDEGKSPVPTLVVVGVAAAGLTGLTSPGPRAGIRADRPASVRLFGLGKLPAVDGPVVAGDVPHPDFGEQVVAAVHLLDGPGEGVRRLLRVDHDLGQQVGKVVVLTQLDPLGVDQDEAHLVGGRPGQDRGQDGVDAGRLPRARRPGDEHVGHLGEIGQHRPTGDVTTEGDLERVVGSGRLR